MLNTELDDHLDNEKHGKTKYGNYRKEYETKKIKSSYGEWKRNFQKLKKFTNQYFPE